jgi:alpha-glucosidase
MAEPWWKSAVVYQIYPRSFLDTTGDGVGDLEGIRRKLGYVAELGVDTIWLSPFYPSPMADFGYDVADHCDVDPLFGSLADFDRLLAEAHAAGLKVLIDWVPNHTSDQHPWFVEARSSRHNPKRDWYIWRDQPNNWTCAFTRQPAWTWDEATGQYYLHLFLAEQPDLNWANPEVREAMYGVVRFWLDRGVDGLRIDVMHGLGKDPAFPDDPPELAALPHSSHHDDPRTHPIIRELRSLVDSYPGERMMVGEVYILDTHKVASYYGTPSEPELHLSFNFPPLYTAWDAAKWRRQIERAARELDPREAWPTWVLSNHDNPRHHTRYGSEARARAAAVLLLTLRGTPFLYAGEELGLADASVPPERVVDPGGRDGCRAPLPWTAAPDHGWGVSEPWLPWPPEADARNAESLEADRSSILWLYRSLLAARRGSDALRLGSLELLDGPEGVVAFRRTYGDDVRTVLVNFTDAPVRVDLPGVTGPAGAASAAAGAAGTVEVGTGTYVDGVLGPDAAVVLR